MNNNGTLPYLKTGENNCFRLLFLHIFDVLIYLVMKLSTLYIAFVFTILFMASACKDEPEDTDSVPDTYSLVNMLPWNYSSAPLRFTESNLTNNTAYGFNRAKIAWYNIDVNTFYDKSVNRRPPNISNDDLSADDCRIIYESELFPGKEPAYNMPLNLNVFNIDYYPSEKGPWNYDTQPSAYSAGIGYDGNLNEPISRWAGVTREIEATDYKMNYIDFWLVDPFSTYPDAKGELYIDLGDISKDVMKDGLISAENTTTGTAGTSVWGLVKPLTNTNSFPASNPEILDTGLDELLNNEETTFFSSYLDAIHVMCDPAYYALVSNDPANDDYHSYLGDDYDQLNFKIRDRYKNFNGGEKNSFPFTNDNAVVYQRNPNSEDINNNGILDTSNNYYEFKISIEKGTFTLNTNNIVEIIKSSMATKLYNGRPADTKFYHFRIPLAGYSAIYGAPDLSTNPKFIRLYLTGFSSPVNLRFINLMLSKEIIDYSIYY